MVTNITLLLVIVTVSSVASQTFQYSRGWTNGKRDGHKSDEVRDVAASLERILSPCQMNKLKYVLEGRPLNERLFGPCEYEEEETQPKRFNYLDPANTKKKNLNQKDLSQIAAKNRLSKHFSERQT